jgi:hypothetical protein
MDSAHDLIGVDAWRESLARSRARRGKPMPSEAELTRWVAAPRLDRAPLPNAKARRRRPKALIASPAGVLVVALLAALLPSVSDGLAGPRARAGAPHRLSPTNTPQPRPAGPAPAIGPGACQRVARSDGYVNPLAGAILRPKRVDQGIDYEGTGTLTALGAGTITMIATSDTGWPGAFIEYRLTAGPAAGCYVFYAEGLVPAADLHAGERVRPGQPIAALIPGDDSGIEIGWGAGQGTETYAATLGEWSTTADNENIPTAAGRSFNRLIQSLGGPPGRIEG